MTKDSRTPIKVGIPGGFMVYNTLDVLGAALALGVPLEKSARVLAAVPHVKGRVEVVPTPGKDYTVLIDYSHTPDSLENILRTVKGFAKGRTVALFGCGGDRTGPSGLLGQRGGGAGGLCGGDLRQPPDRGPGGHHRRHPAGPGGQRHPLPGDLRPGGGHPLGDGPRAARAM